MSCRPRWVVELQERSRCVPWTARAARSDAYLRHNGHAAICRALGSRPTPVHRPGPGAECADPEPLVCWQERVSQLKGVRCPHRRLRISRGECRHKCPVLPSFSPRISGYPGRYRRRKLNWLTVLETRQLLNLTILRGRVWVANGACGGVSEPPRSVDVGKKLPHKPFRAAPAATGRPLASANASRIGPSGGPPHE